MAVNLVVQHKNKRHNLRAGPMKPLSFVLEELCQKLKPRIEPQRCQLLLKGEPVDLSTPLRLMNIPPGVKLELVSSEEPASTAPVVNNTPRTPLEKRDAAREPGAQSIPTTSDVQRGVTEFQTRMNEGAREASEEAKDQVNQIDGEASSTPKIQGVAAGGPPDNGNQGEPNENKGESRLDGWRSLTSEGRKFCLFRRDALFGDGGSGVDEEVPDDFYDFTPEDYQRVMKEHKEKVAFQEAGLRTRALREFAEHAKAQALGPVNLRLFFPSGEVCQTEFRATDTIREVYDFSSELVKGGRGSFVLYTAPPRLDLVEEELTLYKAELIPAANVYVAVSKPSKKGKRKMAESEGVVELKEDVLACLMEKPPISQQDSVETQRKRGNTTEGAAGRSAVQPSAQAPAKPKKGIPKWMKL